MMDLFLNVRELLHSLLREDLECYVQGCNYRVELGNIFSLYIDYLDAFEELEI